MSIRPVPQLKDLPPPPPDKTGWPWTEESDRLSEEMPDGSEWPRISIVTPNYNYAHFLEETIRSILLQGYPNLEYIIIDGGSSDNSLEIIEKYQQWLDYYVSEKDSGQANAINKGLAQCTGKIFNWINSDDILTQGSLKLVAEGIKNFDAFAGAVLDLSETGIVVQQNQGLSAFNMVLPDQNVVFHQPGFWLRTDLICQIGGLPENFDFCFDWELVIKYLYSFDRINYTSLILAHFRIHPNSKTTVQAVQFEIEREKILSQLMQDLQYAKLHKYISLRKRQKYWNKFITNSLDFNSLNKPQRINQSIKILINSCFDPKIRWSRFTLGAIRKTLSA
ncbi:glycosyltransferase family 2 protein [Nostoc sp. C117]|uniref:glycosyltransferase family 2 protein n=1 Tax=Nostoc sp. C117 TaxID=3349875 RepID=UPI00370DDAB4